MRVKEEVEVGRENSEEAGKHILYLEGEVRNFRDR